MKTTLINGLVVTLSLLLTVAVGEAIARLLVPPRTAIKVHAMTHPDDIRLRADTEHHVSTPEYSYIQFTNSYGRRDVEWTPEMIVDPSNIILIGDSFVMGIGVDHRSTIATLLEKHFAKDGHEREVFNFGVGGASTPEYTALLQDALGIGLAARTAVVAIFLGNDFNSDTPVTSSHGQRRNDNAARTVLPFADSRLLQFVADSVKYSTRLTGLILRIGGYVGVRSYYSPAGYIFLRDYTRKEEARFYNILSHVLEAQRIAYDYGKELIIVLIPNKIQVENHHDLSNSIYDGTKPNKTIMRFCKTNSLACLDLLPALRAQYEKGELLYYEQDRHFNARGNAVAAREIYRFLVSRHAKMALARGQSGTPMEEADHGPARMEGLMTPRGDRGTALAVGGIAEDD